MQNAERGALRIGSETSRYPMRGLVTNRVGDKPLFHERSVQKTI